MKSDALLRPGRPGDEWYFVGRRSPQLGDFRPAWIGFDERRRRDCARQRRPASLALGNRFIDTTRLNRRRRLSRRKPRIIVSAFKLSQNGIFQEFDALAGVPAAETADRSGRRRNTQSAVRPLPARVPICPRDRRPTAPRIQPRTRTSASHTETIRASRRRRRSRRCGNRRRQPAHLVSCGQKRRGSRPLTGLSPQSPDSCPPRPGSRCGAEQFSRLVRRRSPKRASRL